MLNAEFDEGPNEKMCLLWVLSDDADDDKDAVDDDANDNADDDADVVKVKPFDDDDTFCSYAGP